MGTYRSDPKYVDRFVYYSGVIFCSGVGVCVLVRFDFFSEFLVRGETWMPAAAAMSKGGQNEKPAFPRSSAKI